MGNKQKSSNNAHSEPLQQTDVISRFLIYADDYITWNDKIGEWNYNDEFTGTFLDAHSYARSKYGKKYVLQNGL